MNFNHTSVLLKESIDGLHIKDNGTYMDGTLGGAGHSSEIVKQLGKNGLLIGVDQDENAIIKASEVLKDYKDKISLVRANFAQTDFILQEAGVENIDGVLLDLGVSSHQLDEASRGFSYMQDAPLDMRMDNRNDFSAYNVVNEYSVQELTRMMQDYGEERWAKRIAEFIVNERKTKPIATTFELVTVIKKAVPKGARQDGPHPAKRTFQAIRIEVNDEINILEKTVEAMVEKLNSGGRICIITFHSLEDRTIKNVFRKLEKPCTCPREMPICVCGKEPSLRILTRKPIIPSAEELEVNHRARSAKLRIAEKI